MLNKFLDAHEQTNKNKSSYDSEIWKKAVKNFPASREIQINFIDIRNKRVSI